MCSKHSMMPVAQCTLVSMSVLLHGVHIPRLLAEGTFHRGLAAFIATEPGGGPLSVEILRSHPQLAEQVLQSLAAVHQHGVCMEMCNCTILWLRLTTEQFDCCTLNTAAWVIHMS